MEDQPQYIQLQNWFKSQTKWKTKVDFARDIGINIKTLIDYFSKKNTKPTGERRQKLYEVTGLECFKPEITETKEKIGIEKASMEVDKPFHILLQNWFNSQTEYSSVQEFANAVGTSHVSIYRYLRGVGRPSRKDIIEKIRNITGIDPLKYEVKVPKKVEKIEVVKPIVKPLDLKTDIINIQDDIKNLSIKIESFSKLTENLKYPDCNNCLINLFVTNERGSVYERVEFIKLLLYLLDKELDFFKKGTPGDRKIFRESLHGPDVGYVTALLRAIFDEDKFQNWILMTKFNTKLK